MAEWAEGLERTGERKLDDEEHRVLCERITQERQRVLRVRRFMIGVSVGSWALWLLFLLLRAIPGLFVMTFVGVLAVCLAAIAWSRRNHWLPVLATIEKDLVDRTVARFTAESPEGEAPFVLEILPRSRLITRRGEVVAEDWEFLEVVEVAPVSPSLPAPWPTPVDDLPEGVTPHQRHLSEAETHELRGHADRLRNRAVVLPLVVTYLGAQAATFVTVLFKGGPASLDRLPISALLIVLAVAAVPAVLTWRRRAVLLSDIAAGKVGLLRFPDGEELEILTHSGIVWSANGRPAPWRTWRW